MKKALLLVCSVAILALVAAGCGSKADQSELDLSNSTVYGQIQSIDGQEISLQLGKAEAATMGGVSAPGGANPATPTDNNAARPSTDSALSSDKQAADSAAGNEQPAADKQTAGSTDTATAPTLSANSATTHSGNASEANGPQGIGGKAYTFTANDNTVTIKVDDSAKITLADGSEGSLDDLKQGDVLEVVVGGNNQVASIKVLNIATEDMTKDNSSSTPAGSTESTTENNSEPAQGGAKEITKDSSSEKTEQ